MSSSSVFVPLSEVRLGTPAADPLLTGKAIQLFDSSNSATLKVPSFGESPIVRENHGTLPHIVSTFARQRALDTASTTTGRESIHRIRVLAEWDGYVESIGPTSFTARLFSLNSQSNESSSEEAEVPLSDVRPADLELFSVGAIFRLTVGLSHAYGGPMKFTTIIFRRLPAYTQRELAEAEKYASEMDAKFQLGTNQEQTSG